MQRSDNEWIRLGNIHLSRATMVSIHRKAKGNVAHKALLCQEAINEAFCPVDETDLVD